MIECSNVGENGEHETDYFTTERTGLEEWRTERTLPSGVERQERYDQYVCIECGGVFWHHYEDSYRKSVRYYYDGDNKRIGEAVDKWERSGICDRLF